MPRRTSESWGLNITRPLFTSGFDDVEKKKKKGPRKSMPVSVGGISIVKLIQDLCRNAMEKLTREDAYKCPCQIKRLEDVTGVISSLANKLPLKLVKELKVELQFKGVTATGQQSYEKEIEYTYAMEN